MRWLKRLRTWFRPAVCRHEFKYADLKLTEIPEPETPKDNDYLAWQKYYSIIYTHDSVTKRVVWTCYKCGRVFYASCGLDILAHHGHAVPDEAD